MTNRTHAVSYRPRPDEIPTSPGVYRFHDNKKRVLYVGKAKNLRARLSNYFAPPHTLNERTRRMVTTASSVEWTIVSNEFEALQLEFTWIKEFNPPFNVQFKDDKSYPYLAVTLGEEVPRVLITRNHKISNARYFGPYTKVWAIRETVDLLLKAFPMRSCSDGVYKRAHQVGRPCLLGDIGRCVAPCVGRVTFDEHRSVANDFVSFMAGNDTRHIQQLTTRMNAAAARQDYETAARYRDSIGALKTVLEKTAVVFDDRVDADVFGIADDELAAAVQQFLVRGGRIRGVRSWVVDKELDMTVAELVGTVLHNAYENDFAPPREVLVPELPEDSAELQLWLTERRHEREGPRAAQPKIRVPRRGDKASLIHTAELNAKNALKLYKTRRSANFVARSQALTDLQHSLGMAEAPLRIECFDVSHLAGTNVVASMVVFEDGLPRKDQYRRFSIPTTTGDTDSIYQIVKRRLRYLVNDQAALTHIADPSEELVFPDAQSPDTQQPVTESSAIANDSVSTNDENISSEGSDNTAQQRRKKFSYPPNLLIVDGGQPQVNAATQALCESGVVGISLCGIAKRLEEIWLSGEEFPVILPRNSDALFLIQRIRDEAHRFAITYQRASRKRTLTSSLAHIPGLGDTRVKTLLRQFGSVTKLKNASLEDIMDVPGIGPNLAQNIYQHLHTQSRKQ